MTDSDDEPQSLVLPTRQLPSITQRRRPSEGIGSIGSINMHNNNHHNLFSNRHIQQQQQQQQQQQHRERINRRLSRDEIWIEELSSLPWEELRGEVPNNDTILPESALTHPSQPQQQLPNFRYDIDDDHDAESDDKRRDSDFSTEIASSEEEGSFRRDKLSTRRSGSEYGSIGMIVTSSNSSLPVSTIRSQQQVQKRFNPKLKSNNKIYRKSVTSFIRHARKGETIVTVIDGKPETRYEVTDETSYVVCGKIANEYYVITNKDFHENYDESSCKPIKATSTRISNNNNNNTDNSSSNNNKDKPFQISEYQARRFRKAGFCEYSSKRQAWAYQVTIRDMGWFQGRDDGDGAAATPSLSITSIEESSFIAPWGETMRVELGDYLVMTYPYTNGEVYRIGRDVFLQTYVENSVQGHFKDLAILFEIARNDNTTMARPNHSLFSSIETSNRNNIANGTTTTTAETVDRTGTWNKIRDRLNRRGKSELLEFCKIRDVQSRNRAALHIAIDYGAPYDIIETLFYAAPMALSDAELQRFVAKYRGEKEWKQSALHLACYHNAPSEVIEYICKKLPKAATAKDAFGWLPLHFACKAEVLDVSSINILKKVFPTALTMKNNKGATPLLLAMHHKKVCFDVIYSLTTDDSAKIPDPRGRLPLYLAIVKGLSEEILDHLFLFHPEAIAQKDELGRTPFEVALENVENTPNGLHIIKFLADEYPMVLTATNSKGATPLMQAIDQGIANSEIISSLLTEEAAKLEDNGGFLPLHCACMHGSPKEILGLLLLIYPEAISCEDKSCRKPFECALKCIGNSPNGPSIIRFLVDRDKTLVNSSCSNGMHAMAFLLDCMEPYACFNGINDKTICEARERYCDAFRCILEAGPDEDRDFFIALENLPRFLEDDAFEITVNSKLSRRRKHIQLDIFFSKFHPETFRRLMLLCLESDSTEDCLDWMNQKSCKDWVVFLMMIQLYMQCAWIWLFIEASVRYVTSYDGQRDYMNIAIALIPLALLFILFEITQFRAFQRTGVARSYLTDAWNYLDMITICLVLTSASLMIANPPSDETNDTARSLLISTGMFLFLELVSFLKKMFLPFAIFVSGVLKIFVKLIPFGVLAALVLWAFAYMFFIERHDCPVGDDDDFRYDTLLHSFLSTFSSFVGDPPNSKNWLDILFGIVTILVLLNVIIAIVSQEWDDATKEASKAFWWYRLDFLQEISREFRLPGKVGESHRVSKKIVEPISFLDEADEADKAEALPLFFATVNKLLAPNDQYSFKSKWKNKSAPLWSYFLYWAIYAGFFVAGLVSAGLLWPTVIRMDVFGSCKKKSSKRDILDQVETIEKKMQSLDSKINLLQQQFQDVANEADNNILGLVEKMDLMLVQISKFAESKS